MLINKIVYYEICYFSKLMPNTMSEYIIYLADIPMTTMVWWEINDFMHNFCSIRFVHPIHSWLYLQNCFNTALVPLKRCFTSIAMVSSVASKTIASVIVYAIKTKTMSTAGIVFTVIYIYKVI